MRPTVVAVTLVCVRAVTLVCVRAVTLVCVRAVTLVCVRAVTLVCVRVRWRKHVVHVNQGSIETSPDWGSAEQGRISGWIHPSVDPVVRG